MNILKIAMCEDDTAEQERLSSILKKYTNVNLSIFNSGEDFLENYDINKFDLIFMDIYMNGMTGVETIGKIRQFDEEVLVAFTTTSQDHALDSYRLDAVKYLEKPVMEKEILKVLDMAKTKKQSKPKFSYKVHGELENIFYCEIMYLEQKSHDMYICLASGEKIIIKEKINNVADDFEKNGFISPHKSYMVNLSYIKDINKDLMVFEMVNDDKVYIRRESFSKTKKAFENYLFESARKKVNV